MGFLKSAMLILLTAILVKWMPTMLRKRDMHVTVHGKVEAGWEKVAAAFRHNLVSGLDSGGSISVWHKNKMVVNLWGGSADLDAAWEIEENTLFQIFSCTKAIAAIAVAVLVDRGHLDYKQPVSKYWPDFAQNGKEGITVEQLVSHQAGLAVVEEELKLSDMRGNPKKFAGSLAKQRPNWTPGKAHGYHMLTFAMYIDFLIQHADPKKRTIEEFFDTEIAAPLGLDTFIGLPQSEHYRNARSYPAAFLSWDSLTASRYRSFYVTMLTQPESLSARSLYNPKDLSNMEVMNNPLWKSYPLASSHGFSTAKSLAKLYALLANNGTLDQVTLMSPKTVALLIEQMVSGHDLISQNTNSFTRGFSIIHNTKGLPTYGTPGAGGQVAHFEPSNHLAISYLTNHHTIFVLNDAPKYISLERAIYDCINNLKKNAA